MKPRIESETPNQPSPARRAALSPLGMRFMIFMLAALLLSGCSMWNKLTGGSEQTAEQRLRAEQPPEPEPEKKSFWASMKEKMTFKSSEPAPMPPRLSELEDRPEPEPIPETAPAAEPEDEKKSFWERMKSKMAQDPDRGESGPQPQPQASASESPTEESSQQAQVEDLPPAPSMEASAPETQEKLSFWARMKSKMVQDPDRGESGPQPQPQASASESPMEESPQQAQVEESPPAPQMEASVPETQEKQSFWARMKSKMSQDPSRDQAPAESAPEKPAIEPPSGPSFWSKMKGGITPEPELTGSFVQDEKRYQFQLPGHGWNYSSENAGADFDFGTTTHFVDARIQFGEDSETVYVPPRQMTSSIFEQDTALRHREYKMRILVGTISEEDVLDYLATKGSTTPVKSSDAIIAEYFQLFMESHPPLDPNNVVNSSKTLRDIGRIYFTEFQTNRYSRALYGVSLGAEILLFSFQADALVPKSIVRRGIDTMGQVVEAGLTIG